MALLQLSIEIDRAERLLRRIKLMLPAAGGGTVAGPANGAVDADLQEGSWKPALPSKVPSLTAQT